MVFAHKISLGFPCQRNNARRQHTATHNEHKMLNKSSILFKMGMDVGSAIFAYHFVLLFYLPFRRRCIFPIVVMFVCLGLACNLNLFRFLLLLQRTKKDENIYFVLFCVWHHLISLVAFACIRIQTNCERNYYDFFFCSPFVVLNYFALRNGKSGRINMQNEREKERKAKQRTGLLKSSRSIGQTNRETNNNTRRNGKRINSMNCMRRNNICVDWMTKCFPHTAHIQIHFIRDEWSRRRTLYFVSPSGARWHSEATLHHRGRFTIFVFSFGFLIWFLFDVVVPSVRQTLYAQNCVKFNDYMRMKRWWSTS